MRKLALQDDLVGCASLIHTGLFPHLFETSVGY